MALSQPLMRYGQRRVLSRATRAIPWLGAVVALATIGAAVRRKGLFRGALDSALNAVPVVGGVKLAAEVVRGRDFLRDRVDTPVMAGRRSNVRTAG
jgi:hypothetical protein